MVEHLFQKAKELHKKEVGLQVQTKITESFNEKKFLKLTIKKNDEKAAIIKKNEEKLEEDNRLGVLENKKEIQFDIRIDEMEKKTVLLRDDIERITA